MRPLKSRSGVPAVLILIPRSLTRVFPLGDDHLCQISLESDEPFKSYMVKQTERHEGNCRFMKEAKTKKGKCPIKLRTQFLQYYGCRHVCIGSRSIE